MRTDLLAGLHAQTGTQHRDYDTYTLAQVFFEAGDYIRAAALLREMGAEQATSPLAARMLLARALFSSAQLGRAEALLREVVAAHPDEAYAHLLLGRVLQRRSRPDEAAPHLRLAAALGVPLDG